MKTEIKNAVEALIASALRAYPTPTLEQRREAIAEVFAEIENIGVEIDNSVELFAEAGWTLPTTEHEWPVTGFALPIEQPATDGMEAGDDHNHPDPYPEYDEENPDPSPYYYGD